MTPRGTDFVMPGIAALVAPPGALARPVTPVADAPTASAAALPASTTVLPASAATGGPRPVCRVFAVQHTASGQGGTFAVIICSRPPAVRICVTDGGAPTGPSVATPGPLTTSGRGLAIVDALASQWGHHAGPSGRAVWFELGGQK
jgi:hypothetical protein